ncbi:MAG: TraB/GumN family protein [Gammaproteobacteria bacterium]
MFRRHFAAVLIVAAAAVTVTACTTATPTTPMPKTALWKVTSAHRTLYITGDMNVSLKKYPVPAPMTRAFAESGKLVFEGNPNPGKAKVMPLVMKLGLQPSGQKLGDDLNASQLKLVKDAFSSVDVPFANVQHFRPWLAAVTLSGHLFLKFGVKPHQLHLYFYDEAKADKMPVTFLDTVAQELKMVADMPPKLQVNLLVMTAKEALEPNRSERRARMIQAWRSGDMETVAKIADKGFQGYPQVYKVMVTSRHPRWLKTLESKLDELGKPVFVIVGGPHLFGPGNLLSGLRKAGYQVTQL